MRFTIILLISIFYSFGSIHAQSELQLIQTTLDRFIEGTLYNDPELIESAFFTEAQMYLYNDADTLLRISPEKYASYYDNGRKGQLNNRPTTVVDIKIEGTVAYAQLQVDIPSYGNRYNDLLLLKKINGQWLIVSKVTSAGPIPLTAMEHKPKPVKEIIVSGLKKPWSMAFISEYSAIVAEKEGDLLLVNLQDKSTEKILGLPTDVGKAMLIDTGEYPKGIYAHSMHGNRTAYNAGWFQVLLDPDYAVNKLIYLSYAAVKTDKRAALKVIRGKLSGNQLTEIETIYDAGPYVYGLFHFGGGMTFGNDGMLYIATGDRNFFEYVNPTIPYAQDSKDPRGKIIRLHTDGSIPNDNPDFGKTAVPGLYALGIRATQGLFTDSSTGQIWFTDHGTNQGDEFNLLKAGANYGWPNVTSGTYRTPEYQPQGTDDVIYIDPIHYWEQTIAPTGLVQYSGREFKQWKGDFIIPGLSKGNLWRISLDENNVVTSIEELFPNDRIRLRKAIQSPRGYLYVLTDEIDGKIIKIKNKD